MNIKQISVLILLAISLLASAHTFGHTFAKHDSIGKSEHKKSHFKKAFSQLDLSEQQKQTMQSLLAQTREENAIYRVDRKKFRNQTQQLMNSPAWDEDFAISLVTAQLQQGQVIQLNIAKTQHQLFNMLDKDQQAEFLANAEKRKQRIQNRLEGKSDNAIHPRMSKLVKVLDLSDEQIQAIAKSREETKALRLANKDGFAQMREKSVALIQAKEFDEKAWIALQEQNIEFKTRQRVSQLNAQYDMLSVLTDEQKKKFKKIMKKVKDRQGGMFNA